MKWALGLVLLACLWWLQRGPALDTISPRMISNQTPQPLALYGKRFTDPLAVTLKSGGKERTLSAKVTDAGHAYLRLPDDIEGDTRIVVNGEERGLTVIDDRHFCDPVALASDASHAFIVSTTTDELFTVELSSKAVATSQVDDGPRAIALWNGKPVIAFAFTSSIAVLDGEKVKRYAAPLGGSALWIDRDIAYVSGQVSDEVWAIDLRSGETLWRAEVAPNPSSITGHDDVIVVGSQQVGAIDVLARGDGRHLHRISPDKQTHILSGRTQAYSPFVIGGKAVRGLAMTETQIFVSSIGPNVGPNPSRLEVTHDAGISVIDRASNRVVRHIGLGAGVTEGIVADALRLYTADIASGLVHVFDKAALLADATAQNAKLASIAIAPPQDISLVRADLMAGNRTGNEVHSGPRALTLSADGGTLYVLNRLSATLAIVDTKTSLVTAQILLGERGLQEARRRGEVLYYGDLARSGMSCDSCHPDGHMDGVFFEKTRPMRIYRATSIRAAALTPPYFIPTSTATLAETSSLVGNRNRFMRLAMTQDELDALTLFSASIALLPNPFLGVDGAPKEELTLPDGHVGHPRKGVLIFEGKAGCSGCHKAPDFVSDDTHDVATPHVFPLRAHLQDGQLTRFPAPSLLGAWDVFPMLTSGAAGFGVDVNEQLFVRERFVLRDAMESFGGDKHGRYQSLDASDRDDLLAYVLSL